MINDEKKTFGRRDKIIKWFNRSMQLTYKHLTPIIKPFLSSSTTQPTVLSR